jgi:guanylate kinase
MTTQGGRGKMVIVSGPSGAGKTTLMNAVARRTDAALAFSVSATTRPPRPGEVDGVDYHFLAPQEFQRRRENGEFLECFAVFGGGTWYGTLESEVLPRIAAGKWVVLRIDVQGALALMQRFPDALSIFLHPRSTGVLEARLRGRRTDGEQAIERRLETARNELALADRYRYRVVNDAFDAAVREICDILRAEAAATAPSHT